MACRLTPDVVAREMQRLGCTEDAAVASLARAEARSAMGRVFDPELGTAEAA